MRRSLPLDSIAAGSHRDMLPLSEARDQRPSAGPGDFSGRPRAPCLVIRSSNNKPIGCRPTPLTRRFLSLLTNNHLAMSVATERMDAEDLREVDWLIIDTLRDGRNNAPNIAEELGYSRQYIRERLGQLKQADIIVSIGSGIYELVPEEVPNET